MGIDPATLLLVELGGAFLFFLLLPFLITLSRLPAVWRANRGLGVVLAGVIVLTGIFFVLFLAGMYAISFWGRGEQ